MTSHHVTDRRVVANIGPSIDGYYRRHGYEGIAYLADVEAGYEQITRTIETATPAILGRINAEVFLTWWPSVIKALLAANMIDRLNLVIAPVVGGDGDRLFDDGNQLTNWELTHHEVSEPGVLALTYDRKS